MAANTRRIEMTSASGLPFGEFEDAESMTMTRVRDGGDVSFQASFVREFRDYEHLVDLEKCFLAYYPLVDGSNQLRFSGRVKRLDSDWKAKKVTVIAESYAAVLKEIKEEIYIRESDGDYSGLYVDNEIDVGEIVFVLWTNYIKDLGKPVGFRHAVDTASDIDRTTGYTLKDFRWDGQSSLFEIMKGLSKAAQYASWGFQDRDIGKFYFKKHGLSVYVNDDDGQDRAWRYSDAEYMFTTRKNVVSSSTLIPHITELRESLDLGRTPTAIHITGGNIGNRVFSYYKTNTNWSYGRNLIKRIYLPWITDETTASNVADNLFGYYYEPEPLFEFTVWPLLGDLTYLGGDRYKDAAMSSHSLWKPAGIEMIAYSTIAVSRMTKIVYHYDSVISADISLGDNEALDMAGEMKKKANEGFQAAVRPAV